MKMTHSPILFATGCALVATIVTAVAGGPASAAPAPAGRVEKGGAQLWAENCQRCHNLRAPNSYSPAQWDVAMLHMRIRANLTPGQTQKILDFLKSSS